MNLLAGLLCSSLLVLVYGQDSYNQRSDNGQVRRQTDIVPRKKRQHFSSDVLRENTHAYDELMKGANFQQAHRICLGYCPRHHRGKRDVVDGQMNGEEQVVPREKRQYFNADVQLKNNYAHDESINLEETQFGGASNFNIRHKRGKREVEDENTEGVTFPESYEQRIVDSYKVTLPEWYCPKCSMTSDDQRRGKRDVEAGTDAVQAGDEELFRQKRDSTYEDRIYKKRGVEPHFSTDEEYSQHRNYRSFIWGMSNTGIGREFIFGNTAVASETQKNEAIKTLVRGKRTLGHVDRSYKLQNVNFKDSSYFRIDAGRTRVFDDPNDRSLDLRGADYSGRSHFTVTKSRTRLFPKKD